VLDSRDSVCKVKLFSMVGLIFVSGMVTGAFSWNFAQKRWFPPKAPVLTSQGKAAALKHFNQELDLTEQQAQAIESILDQFIMEQAELMSRYQTSRVSSHDRLYQVLNEEQRKRLRKILDELSNQQQH
jgi:hypothetical protein